MNFNNLHVLASLGHGGYGQVYMAVAKKSTKHLAEKQVVAIKAIRKTKAKSAKVEIEVLNLDHF